MVVAHAGIGTIGIGIAIAHVYRFSRCMRHAIPSSARAVPPIDIRSIPGGESSAAIFFEHEHK
jgi:hypothetical protein